MQQDATYGQTVDGLDEELKDQAIDQDDCWKVIDSYFKRNGLVTQQLDSFERFLKYE